jgi:hypothetical protein
MAFTFSKLDDTPRVAAASLNKLVALCRAIVGTEINIETIDVVEYMIWHILVTKLRSFWKYISV